MLGFSLPAKLFLSHHPDDFDNSLYSAYNKQIETLLQALKAAGISSIEIRMLPRVADGSQFQEVIQMIWEQGLQLTVHGGLEGNRPGQNFAEIYPSMDYILKNFRRYQNDLMITVHPLCDHDEPGKDIDAVTRDLSQRTTDQLKDWAAMLQAEPLPIRLALELNRHKRPAIDPGDTCDGVIEMVTGVNHPQVGICWDMGHYYSNLVTSSNLEDVPDRWIEELPPATFINRVVHTHIHGLFGRTGTHYPLTPAHSLPLELYVSTLCRAGYQGVFNLELSWEKWPRESVREEMLSTIHRLSEAVRP